MPPDAAPPGLPSCNAAGELHEYVADEVNVRALTPCADAQKYCRWASCSATTRGGQPPQQQVQVQGSHGAGQPYICCWGKGQALLCDRLPCCDQPCSVRAEPEWGVLGKRLGKSMGAVAKAVKALPMEVSENG